MARDCCRHPRPRTNSPRFVPEQAFRLTTRSMSVIAIFNSYRKGDARLDVWQTEFQV